MTTAPPDPRNIFISYARVDANYAEALERALSASGVLSWREKSQIELDWSREIGEALAASSACCVLWTHQASSSKWVRHEWLTARALGKPVYLIAPDGISPLPTPLQNSELIGGSDPNRWADRIVKRQMAESKEPVDYTTVPPGSSIPFLPNPRFAGRANDLLTLYLTTIAGLNKLGRSLMGLVGLPGTGKTQLAVEFGYRFAFAFDRVLWLQGADPMTWRTQLARLGRDVMGHQIDPADDGAAVRRLGVELSSSTTLLIIDNVEEPLMLNREGVLGVDVPATLISLGASLLYTSRRASSLPAGESFEVRELDEIASMRLLTADRLPQDSYDTAAANQILQLVAGLPLALVLVNAYLRSYREVTYSEVAVALRERTVTAFDHLGLTPEQLATRHDVVLSATLESHIESLRSAHARPLLQIIAMLGESVAVPIRQLELLANVSPGGASLARPFPRAVAELERLSLAERLSSHRLRVHPLIGKFVLELLAPEQLKAIRAGCSANVRAFYTEALHLRDELLARGAPEVIDDLAVADRWCEPNNADQHWLGTIRRALERELPHLSNIAGQPSGRSILQQLAWRCREMSEPELAGPLEHALNAVGEIHIIARAVIPPDDPALLREATQRPPGMMEGRWDKLAIHPSGTLVTWGWNIGVVWDVDTLRPLLSLRGGSAYLFAVEISTSGDMFFAVDSNGWFRAWGLPSGVVSGQHRLKLRKKKRGFKARAAAISTRGQRIVLAYDNREAFSEFDEFSEAGESVLASWRIGPDGVPTEEHVFPIGAHWLNEMGIDEIGHAVVVPGANEGTADIYDIATGQRTAELAGYHSSWKVQSASSFALSTRQNIVVAQICDDIVLWDVATGSLSYLSIGGQFAAGIAINHKASELISTDRNTITRWDLSTRQPLRQYRAVAPQSATFDEDRRLLVSGGVDGYIATWNLDAFPSPQVVGHVTSLRQVLIGTNRQLLLSLSEDQLCVWSENGAPTGSLPSEKVEIYVDKQGRVVPESNTMRSGHSISAVAADPGGGLLLIVGTAGACSLHSLQEGRIGPQRLRFGHEYPIETCGFADRGKLAVIASSHGELIIVDTRRNRIARTLPVGLDNVTTAAFSRDAPRAIVGSQSGEIRVIDLISGEVVWSFSHQVDQETRERYMNYNLSGEATNIVQLGVSGRIAVFGFVDDRPQVVDLTAQEPLPFPLLGHTDIVWSAAISTDERLVFTGGQDRLVAVWDLATRSCIAEVRLDAPVSAIGTIDNLIALGDERGRIHLAELRCADPLESLRRTPPTPQ